MTNMNYHRLYIIFFLIFIHINLQLAFECDEHSNQDNIPFTIKIKESPYVVIGTSLNKNFDINIRNLFNVTFLVECILKGRPTQRIIQIVQAGSLLGRRSCQQLNVNREYIVFLEPFFDGTYRPTDFQEVHYNNEINILLEKTCGLSRTFPYTEVNDTDAMLTNKCPPSVSTDCPSGILKTIGTSSSSSSTSTKSNSVSTSTISSIVFGKDPIDFAALSLLLAEQNQQNFSLDFLQGQNHKSLFSDDDTHKSHANRLSFILYINFIIFSILYIIF